VTTPDSAVRRRITRLRDLLPAACAIAAAFILIWGATVFILDALNGQVAPIAGVDFELYRSAAQRFLAGGGFYHSYQLDGPYRIADQTMPSAILYPPTTLLIFVPFVFVPAVLWWLIPLAITAWVVRRHSPRPIMWPMLAFLLVFPTTIRAVETGNPTMWITAAFGLGTMYGWPAVLVMAKPTLAPFALVGIQRRSWWLAAVVCAGLSALFLPLWFDYLTALRNAQDGEWWYSLNQTPALFIPLIAWLGSSRRPTYPAATTSDGRTTRAASS
jgi:hypothetical protein